jgi:hypothetical protein
MDKMLFINGEHGVANNVILCSVQIAWRDEIQHAKVHPANGILSSARLIMAGITPNLYRLIVCRHIHLARFPSSPSNCVFTLDCRQ